MMPLLVLLAFPLSYIGTSTLSLAAYRFNAASDRGVRVVESTNLKGLAVPREEDGLLEAFSAGNAGHALLNRSRAVYAQFELSPFEYVETILEAAHLMAGRRYERGGIAVFDQVNPLPFMLGLPPPRGGNLWLGTTKPIPPAERFFAEIDYVLVPKFSTDSPTTKAITNAYAPYLDEHFRRVEESRSWFLFARDDRRSKPRP